MTINLSDNTPRVSYNVAQGVTQTSFTVSFEFFAEADLNVYVDNVLKTLTTDYTVSGGSGSTGSISISVTGATGGSVVTITRDIALERTTDFPSQGAFQIDALNTELDKITAQFADRKDDVDRAMILADSDSAVSMTIPLKANRVGTVLAFNATTGAPEAGPTISDVSTIAAITADIATLADIEDGTDATDAIQTVAGISANVTTVAGISSNVTTVAGNTSNINAVAGDEADIGTVATNIASVNTVATNIADVVTVANDLNEAISEIETAADDLNEAVSEIDTVAQNIANVNAVGAIDSDVTTVAGIAANVTTTAGISSDVTAVAGISGNVTTVAGISADVTTVAADGTDIGTVATNITNVNSVAGNATNINSVAGNSTNINTVAGISADVTTVAGDSAAIQAVAADATDIGTVSTNIANVNTVAGSIANVNTTAANITGVNSFAERYRVGATDPTTSLDEGDLFFNTTDNAYKFYDGSAWQTVNVSGIGSVLDDASPQLGGNLDTNGNDINFGDNDKAIFGAGSDLQIYHDGSNSFIAGNNAANNTIAIKPGGNGSVLITNSSGDNIITQQGDAANLHYDGVTKLATTATGCTITGAVTADGLTVDTNTLHVDATNNSVGIGTASPDTTMHIHTSSAGTVDAVSGGVLTLEKNNHAVLQFLTPNDKKAIIYFGDPDDIDAGRLEYDHSSNAMLFNVNAAERMRLDSSGNLYIAKTSDTSTGVGITLGAAGFIRAVRNETIGVWNRQGSDGTVFVFARSDSGVGSIDVTTSGTTYNTTSDIRLKTDIEPLAATDKLMAMNPVSYNWKVDPDGPRSMGFIAQEMRSVMPEAVSTGEDDDAMMSMDYGRITPILVSALQDAHRKIEDLESRLAAMENN